jgi:hypothetical protein
LILGNIHRHEHIKSIVDTATNLFSSPLLGPGVLDNVIDHLSRLR